MKYKIIFLLLFLFSCTTQTSTSKKSSSYTAKGFAYILPNNLSPKSLDKETYFISHNKFKIGTKIRIINPDNKKFLELTPVLLVWPFSSSGLTKLVSIFSHFHFNIHGKL